MLGFGEIFAKNVVLDYFGWPSRPGATAASAGLGTTSRAVERIKGSATSNRERAGFFK